MQCPAVDYSHFVVNYSAHMQSSSYSSTCYTLLKENAKDRSVPALFLYIFQKDQNLLNYYSYFKLKVKFIFSFYHIYIKNLFKFSGE